MTKNRRAAKRTEKEKAENGRPLVATIAVVAVLALAGAGMLYLSNRSGSTVEGAVTVKLPSLNAVGERGAAVFAENCASCHGTHASGGPGGPPLVHRIYEPNHHGDIAFLYAVRRGVRQHHWGFGNMPAQPQIDDQEIADIVSYVRALQRANGIH